MCSHINFSLRCCMSTSATSDSSLCYLIVLHLPYGRFQLTIRSVCGHSADTHPADTVADSRDTVVNNSAVSGQFRLEETTTNK